ncbi:MAG: monolysocardiolipin acyltransferase [Myxococcota bacterium]
MRATAFRRAATLVVTGTSRLLMQGLNRVKLVDPHHLHAARRLQRPGHGLLTASNHVGLFDDPLLLACFAEPDWAQLRWVAADAVNFFGSPGMALFSSTGKAVPVVRGAGVDQPGMAFLAERLRQGDWVHVFPEGGRSRDAQGRLRRPLKTGLAYLVAAARPLLLTFHHRGMHDVLPIGARLPRVGNTVTVRFAAAVDTDAGLADQGSDAIMRHVETSLLALEAEAFAPEGPSDR